MLETVCFYLSSFICFSVFFPKTVVPFISITLLSLVYQCQYMFLNFVQLNKCHLVNENMGAAKANQLISFTLSSPLTSTVVLWQGVFHKCGGSGDRSLVGHTSNLNIGTVVAAQTDSWHDRICALEWLVGCKYYVAEIAGMPGLPVECGPASCAHYLPPRWPVVKASASRWQTLGSIPAFSVGIFWVKSYQRLKN